MRAETVVHYAEDCLKATPTRRLATRHYARLRNDAICREHKACRLKPWQNFYGCEIFYGLSGNILKWTFFLLILLFIVGVGWVPLSLSPPFLTLSLLFARATTYELYPGMYVQYKWHFILRKMREEFNNDRISKESFSHLSEPNCNFVLLLHSISVNCKINAKYTLAHNCNCFSFSLHFRKAKRWWGRAGFNTTLNLYQRVLSVIRVLF